MQIKHLRHASSDWTRLQRRVQKCNYESLTEYLNSTKGWDKELADVDREIRALLPMSFHPRQGNVKVDRLRLLSRNPQFPGLTKWCKSHGFTYHQAYFPLRGLVFGGRALPVLAAIKQEFGI
jgi:hypothetical protein